MLNEYKPLPPRDWKRYWHSYLGHGLLGVLTALMILTGWTVSGLVFLTIYLVYQYVEFRRRGDTPARDIADFAIGALPILAAYWFWLEGIPLLTKLVQWAWML